MNTLEMIVSRNIRERHRLVCSMGDARESIRCLRQQRFVLALVLKLHIEKK